ncbi:glycoside hydrolase family 16 protein [Gaoshiqia sp. Z1-71]|uniref:glycoside hydrolase family 16 protein n=1 Tax=Gaoshiqia hydrogeniformans TaxID=3290090 RepID=UPI003BF82180
MSFKLFFLKTFKGLNNTDKVEVNRDKLWADYQSFVKVQQSDDLMQYMELDQYVNSPNFKKDKAGIKSKNFEGSQEERKLLESTIQQKEQTYQRLKKDRGIQNYLKYKESNAFAFFRNWDLVFEDRFDGNELDPAKWQVISPVARKTVGTNFSKQGDLHAYTDGKNVQIRNNHLQVVVKREKTESLVWNLPLGFKAEKFDYSSGLLNNVAFDAHFGILEAKIKFQPKSQLVDVFYLSDDKNEARLNLLECGKVCRLGYATGNGKNYFEPLSGLKVGHFYIFRMEWEQGKITWKINNRKVYTLEQQVPDKPMKLNINSIVVDHIENLPHYFEVDWVRFYQKK